MRSRLDVAVFLLFSAAVAAAEDSIPLETLARIKDATAYVKVEAAGGSGSGSGFVIGVEGDRALVITNHHVIQPEIIEITLGGPGPGGGPFGRPPMGPRGPRFPGLTPRIIVRRCKDAKATVVLHSGTPKEESFPAEVLAADPELDLAVLKISGVKGLPLPIDYSHDPKLVETMPVYTFGFPFGKVLATSKGSPAITVGKGSISSLRLDDDGQLKLVQIDGALNPGNSGGPVVDSQGRLVGVAVATISNSSGIGLAIPCRHLSLMLQGRLGKPHLYSSAGDGGQMVIHVEIGLIDPLQKIQSVALYYMAATQVSETPQPTARLSELRGCRKLPLKIDNQVACGEFSPRKGVTEVQLLYQAVCTTSDGKETLTKNSTQTLSLSGAQVAGRAEPEIGAAPARPPLRDGSTGAETQIMGGAYGPQFTDTAPDGGVLIGFEVGLGKWGPNDVVHAIRPIFRSADGKESFGKQHGTDTSRLVVVKAKAGYAVGAITAKSMALLDGFSVSFMKVGKDGLDTKDSYQSDWIGGKGGGPETVLGGDGKLIVGIIGRENADLCSAMGLLRKP